jgi:hypothetical protein
MAPAEKSGMATRSSLGRGYGASKKALKYDSVLMATLSENSPCDLSSIEKAFGNLALLAEGRVGTDCDALCRFAFHVLCRSQL